jgi:hypothetical protein
MKTAIIILLFWVSVSAPAQTSPHGKLRMACQDCHATDSWAMKKDAAFDHSTAGFELTGQHKAAKCASCHHELDFAKAEKTCTSCHTDVHRSELGDNCLRCHGTQSWQVTDMMQRHDQTRFPLAGRHRSALCQSCHINAAQQHYLGTPTTCIGCHKPEYDAAVNPSHAGFSTECGQCHKLTSLAWQGSFDHSLTAFPLTGAHRAAACGSCHANNTFTNISAECVSCHRSEYERTVNPGHMAANFPTTCQSCHTTTAWNGATFDHGATRFALTGAHVSAACQSCHVNGNYQLVYVDCYQCHESQYQSSSNPNHVAGNFPHDCRPCHSTAAWRPSTFNHDQQNFRIYTGKHRGKWNACSDCHLNPANFSVFTCLNCHEHNQTSMDSDHRQVSGYTYSSPACYNCHRGV